MNTTTELVYVEADIYQPNDTEYSDALLDWSDDLWVFPGRPDLSDIMDATDETNGDESVFKTLALRFTINELPNPAFPGLEYKSYVDMLQEESGASQIELFGVDAEEQWWPIIRRHMAERPNANQIGFYAVYSIIETTRLGEDGKDSSIEFEYAGELDMTRLPLVQA